MTEDDCWHRKRGRKAARSAVGAKQCRKNFASAVIKKLSELQICANTSPPVRNTGLLRQTKAPTPPDC